MDYLSNTPIIEEGQHRKFIVEEHRDSFTIVKDAINNITYTSKRLYIPPDQSVILFVSQIKLDQFDSKPYFQYSILNDYEEGGNYIFEVIEEKENGYSIESNESIQTFIPTSFGKFINEKGRIELTIDKFELDKNRLNFFYPEKSGFTHQKISIEQCLELEKVYTFNVTDFKKIDDDLIILLLERESLKYTVRAFPFQVEESLPQIVKCIVTKIQENGKHHLKQDKYSLLKDKYSVGEKYTFSIVNKGIENDTECFYLKDHYGFTHKLFENDFIKEDFEKLEGKDTCELYVRTIEYQHLHLTTNLDHNSEFSSVEDVFKAINETEIDRYFYSLESVYDKDFSRKLKNPFTDHRNKQNLWLFSFLEFIGRYFYKLCENGNYQEAKYFAKLVSHLDTWMIEDSNFLSKFSKEKADKIIFKAEQGINKAKYQIEACELVIDNKSHHYIEKTLQKLKNSGRLREESKGILKEVLSISNELFNRNTEHIIEILHLLLTNNILNDIDAGIFKNILEFRMSTEKKALNKSFQYDNINSHVDNENLLNIVKILYLQILLAEKTNNAKYVQLERANLLRYLSLTTQDVLKKKELLTYAIAVITKGQNLIVEDIDNLKPETITYKPQAVLENQFAYNYFVNNGAVFNSEKGWYLFSQSQIDNKKTEKTIVPTTIASFYGGLLNVATAYTFNSPLISLENYSQYTDNWDEYYFRANYLAPPNLKNNFPPRGSQVEAKVKTIYNKNPELCFLKLMEAEYWGDGALHISEVTNAPLSSFNDLLYTNECLVLHVLETGNKLTFSIKEKLWNDVKSQVRNGQFVNAQVVEVKDSNNACLITEYGASAKCIFPSNIPVKEGQTYHFKVIDENDKACHFICEYHSNTDNKLNGKSEVRKLLKKYIIQDDLVEETDSLGSREHLISVILSLESLVALEEDSKAKLEGLYLLKLLSSIDKNSKSYFFEEQIKFINTLAQFHQLSPFDSLDDVPVISQESIEKFPSLKRIKEDLDLLVLYNDIEAIDSLKTEHFSSEKEELLNLLLAHNILKKYCDEHSNVLLESKMLINNYLSKDKLGVLISNALIQADDTADTIEKDVKPVSSDIPNLGREGKFREFKTSSLFYAGDNSIDIDRQLYVIMKTVCGFLNAEGGSLFIGVFDNGDIAGLKNDYENISGKCNADEYERFLRKYIVQNFNKDVNGLIEFRFNSFQDKEYVEIVIPEYNTPVSLKGDFYQRQGNETRILKGNDLTLFMQRKLNKNSLQKNFEYSKEDFYKEQKSENTDLKTLNEDNQDKLYGYYTLYMNGQYSMSKLEPIDGNIRCVLPIKESDKKGYLLQGYDNGCVNKVKVRTLLDKRFGYKYHNGISKEGNLILLSIVENDILLLVQSKKDEHSYIKLYKSENISPHEHLGLKGNQVVPKEIDSLEEYKVIKNYDYERVKRLIYDSMQPLGKQLNHLSYSEEFKYLKEEVISV